MRSKSSLRIRAELNGLSREGVYWRVRKGMALEGDGGKDEVL